eukprot:7418849-Alexandrium_andersonii.AAC.1
MQKLPASLRADVPQARVRLQLEVRGRLHNSPSVDAAAHSRAQSAHKHSCDVGWLARVDVRQCSRRRCAWPARLGAQT